MEPMFSEDNRLATFKPAAPATKRRQTRADSAPATWPHSTAKNSTFPLPATLAKYGFYFAPDDDAVDRTLHYLYDVSIADWKAGDDPLERLEEASPGNGWCRLWRSKAAGEVVEGADGVERWTWSEAELLPTSKRMVEARRETFGSCWPYDGKKGWKPTSKKLAEAGFHFTPTDEEPDTATCIYCKKILEGWEKGDDPVKEHREREPDCAFFTCSLEEEDKPRGKRDAAASEDEEDNTETVLSRKPKRVVSTYSKRATTRGKKATKAEPEPDTASEVETDAESKATETDADQDVGGEDEEEPPKPVRRGAKKTRSVSTRAKKAVIDNEEEAETIFELAAEEQEDHSAPSRAKAKEAIGKGRPTTARTTRTASRAASSQSKKAASTTVSDAETDAQETIDNDEAEAPLLQEEKTPMPRKVSKARGRTKKATKASETEPEPTLEPGPEPDVEDPGGDSAVSEAEPDANGTIVEHPSAATSELEDDGADEEAEAAPEEQPTPQPKKRGKAAAAATKAKAGRKGNVTKKATSVKTKRATAKTKKGAAGGEATETEPETELDTEAEPEQEAATDSDAEPEPEPEAGRDAVPPEVAAEPEPKAAPAKTVPQNRKTKSTTGSSEMDDVVAAEEPMIEVERSSSPAPLRSPLSQLQALNTLELNDDERAMTLGQWLQLKADEASEEMRLEGERQISDLENRMAAGRVAIERTLRGHS